MNFSENSYIIENTKAKRIGNGIELFNTTYFNSNIWIINNIECIRIKNKYYEIEDAVYTDQDCEGGEEYGK